MDAYRIVDEDGYVGQDLRGPNGFACWLGEPEDRIWYRDGRPVVDELNRLADRLAEVERERDAAREALREVEWAGIRGDDRPVMSFYACPSCGREREMGRGHFPGCSLAAALAPPPRSDSAAHSPGELAPMDSFGLGVAYGASVERAERLAAEEAKLRDRANRLAARLDETAEAIRGWILSGWNAAEAQRERDAITDLLDEDKETPRRLTNAQMRARCRELLLGLLIEGYVSREEAAAMFDALKDTPAAPTPAAPEGPCHECGGTGKTERDPSGGYAMECPACNRGEGAAPIWPDVYRVCDCGQVYLKGEPTCESCGKPTPETPEPTE